MRAALWLAFALLVASADCSDADHDAGEIRALHPVMEEEIAPALDLPLATAREEEEEGQLGEDVGRRGGGMTTSGSFTLSSGSNTAGNDEEDDELEEAWATEKAKEVLVDAKATVATEKAQAGVKKAKGAVKKGSTCVNRETGWNPSCGTEPGSKCEEQQCIKSDGTECWKKTIIGCPTGHPSKWIYEWKNTSDLCKKCAKEELKLGSSSRVRKGKAAAATKSTGDSKAKGKTKAGTSAKGKTKAGNPCDACKHLPIFCASLKGDEGTSAKNPWMFTKDKATHNGHTLCSPKKEKKLFKKSPRLWHFWENPEKTVQRP